MAYKPGALWSHHVAGGVAWENSVAFGAGMICDYLPGHCRAFLVGDNVNGEKLGLLGVRVLLAARRVLCHSE